MGGVVFPHTRAISGMDGRMDVRDIWSWKHFCHIYTSLCHIKTSSEQLDFSQVAILAHTPSLPSVENTVKYKTELAAPHAVYIENRKIFQNL